MPLRRASPGQFVVGGIVFLATLIVVVQAMVFFAGQEARWTKKEERATAAFYLAEAGASRAVWKLKERSRNFEDALSGVPIAGYDADVVYDDVPGGSYRVRFSSGPGEHQITVVSTGKDDSSGEYRSIETVLERVLVPAPWSSPSVALSGAAVLHWGPVTSVGGMNLTGLANQLYPRKLSRGPILASGNYPNRDIDPTPQNTDSLEWWSYNETPGVPDRVRLNLDYYRQLAQAQGTYYAGVTTLANVVDLSTSAVRFFESHGRIAGNSFFKGVVVAMQDLEISAVGDATFGKITVTPPSTAWNEYQKNTPSPGTGCGGGGGAGAANDGNYSNDTAAEGDKACADQYPGDSGYHLAEAYTIGQGCASHGHLGGSLGQPAVFQGFVYVKGQFRATGAAVVHGAVYVDEGGSYGGGTLEVFYDPKLRIVSSDDSTIQFTELSWRETVPSVF